MSQSKLQPPIRLSIVSETWPPEVNGVAHTIKHLADSLWASGCYQIELIRPCQPQDKNRKTKQLAQGKPSEILVSSFCLPFYPEVRLAWPRYNYLKQHWQKNPPNVVQVVTEGALGYSAIKAAKALNIPVFSDFHTHFDQYSRYYGVGLLSGIARYYLRHLHNLTAVTLVPTQAIKQALSEQGYHSLGILPRGVATDCFSPQRYSLALRKKLGVRPGQLLVCLVSRMAREKNLELAFAAFGAIKEVVPEARFLLVGDGPERAQFAARYPDSLFVGMKRGRELAEHYASADLFLHPSVSETFGNVVIEAMASGLPVVSFDYAAAREHIHHGINGIAIPLEDRLAFCQAAARLAQDAKLRQKMGENARETAGQLNWDSVFKCLDRTIRQLAETSERVDETFATA